MPPILPTLASRSSDTDIGALHALSGRCVNPGDSDKACHPGWWLVSLGAFPLLMVLTAALAFREGGGVWRLPRLRG